MATQDVIEGKIPFTIDQKIGVDFEFSSNDLTLKIEDLAERVLKPAMSTIVNDMGRDILDVAYKGFTIGSAPQARRSTR